MSTSVVVVIVIVVAQEEGGPAQRRPPLCVKEGEGGEGVDIREQRLGQGRPRRFWKYRGVRFTRSLIYLLFDVSGIQKLTILSVRVLFLANARKNRLKSPFLCYYRKSICVRLGIIAKFRLC